MIESVNQGREYFKKHLRDKEQECDRLSNNVRQLELKLESANSDIKSIRAENERLKAAHNANIQIFEETKSEITSLRKRCEDLEADNQQLNLKVREDSVRFAMYMSGKSTIGDQDYFIRSFNGGYFKTWKIDN